MDLAKLTFMVVSVVGVIQFIKGIVKAAPTWQWAVIQVVLCFLFAAIWELMPQWVSEGIVCLALSQVGYEAILQNIKVRIDKCV